MCRHVCDEDAPGLCTHGCHITATLQWQRFQRLHLPVSLRQAQDTQLLNFLSLVRSHVPTAAQIHDTFAPCMRSINDPNLQTALDKHDTIWLCTHVADTIVLNDFMLERFFQPHQLLDAGPTFSQPPPPALEEWATTHKHNRLGKVAVGARVMLTTNLKTSKGAVNGAFGTITHVTHNIRPLTENTPDIKRITVRLDNGQVQHCSRTMSSTRVFNGAKYIKVSYKSLLHNTSILPHAACHPIQIHVIHDPSAPNTS